MSRFGRGSGSSGGRGGRSGGSSGRSGGRSGAAVGGVEIIQARVRRHPLIQVSLFLARWSPEFLLAAFLGWLVVRVADRMHFSLLMGGLAVYSMCVVPLVVPVVRRGAWSLVGMNITRHRIRAFFINCRVYNRDGKLPVIIGISATAVGEKIRLWLPAGLSINDLASSTEELASACWARDARVVRSRKYSMVVEVYVIRRDPLATSEPVESAFSGQVDDVIQGVVLAPEDVQDGELYIPPRRPASTPASTSQEKPKPAQVPVQKPVPTGAGTGSGASSVIVGGEDVSDYL